LKQAAVINLVAVVMFVGVLSLFVSAEDLGLGMQVPPVRWFMPHLQAGTTSSFSIESFCVDQYSSALEAKTGVQKYIDYVKAFASIVPPTQSSG